MTRLYDAHNHLQDERLAPYRERILGEVQAEGIERMVVNGSCEADWPAVIELARSNPRILPAFGLHPWYVRERSAGWKARLREALDAAGGGVGEIGLDRWIRDADPADQAEVFTWQLQIAAQRDLPASIHCIQAWGLLRDILARGPRPERGFLLHSYGGPVELVAPLAKLGAYFSLPGYFAHARKQRQRDTFKQVPLERLLIETDAPDQSLPDERALYPLAADAVGKPVNHPANLRAVYEFAAEILDTPIEKLKLQIEENFRRLFGGIAPICPG